jgi:DNA polymerase-3 subunit epsilon
MLEDDSNLAALAEALVRSGDYRVLRRLVPRTTSVPSMDQISRTGVILDVETTGLDQQRDEIIELGMIKFDYLPDGRITGLRDVFTSFNEPSRPIPAEVSALTGAIQTLHLTTNGAESRHGDTVSASTALLRLPRAC